MKDYIEKANRTATTKYGSISQRLESPKTIDLFHAGSGLATEAGEFLDNIKKHVFYGAELDEVNLKEELGDLFWYAALACKSLNVTFEEIMKKNIEKLQTRYPEKFSEINAIVRDLNKERETLES
jgi:NTP pyrophosphatase (non-canonical NTP hydrolase)